MSVAEVRPGCSAARHGDMSAYVRYRCRCADAREEWRLYRKRGREGRRAPRCVPGLGSARRLQALAAFGWSLWDLVEHLGWSKSRVQNVQSLRSPMVTVATAEHVARVYDRLSMTSGPSDRARRLALRRGWAPPLAWDDDEIDSPEARPARMPRAWRTPPDVKRIAAALAGDEAARAALTSPDRRAIVQQLHAEGLTDPEIAARSGIKQNTIRAIRTQLCLSSNLERDVRRRAS